MVAGFYDQYSKLYPTYLHTFFLLLLLKSQIQYSWSSSYLWTTLVGWKQMTYERFWLEDMRPWVSFIHKLCRKWLDRAFKKCIWKGNWRLFQVVCLLECILWSYIVFFFPEGGLPMHDNTCTVLHLTLAIISSHNWLVKIQKPGFHLLPKYDNPRNSDEILLSASLNVEIKSLRTVVLVSRYNELYSTINFHISNTEFPNQGSMWISIA